MEIPYLTSAGAPGWREYSRLRDFKYYYHSEFQRVQRDPPDCWGMDEVQDEKEEEAEDTRGGGGREAARASGDGAREDMRSSEDKSLQERVLALPASLGAITGLLEWRLVDGSRRLEVPESFRGIFFPATATEVEEKKKRDVERNQEQAREYHCVCTV